IDQEPTEERLDHPESSAEQRQHEDHSHRDAVRPQPAQVLAHVLAPLAAARRFRRRHLVARMCRLLESLPVCFGQLVEALMLVVLDEFEVSLTRRAPAVHVVRSMTARPSSPVSGISAVTAPSDAARIACAYARPTINRRVERYGRPSCAA